MQTTTHISDAQAASLIAEMPRERYFHPRSESVHEELMETAATLQMLMRDEADLRSRAAELDTHAGSLENGDDEAQMHADRMRQKCSEDLALADRLKQEASQLKNDPSHKRSPRLSRAEIEAKVNRALSDADHESEAAVSVQAVTSEHKAAIRHVTSHKAQTEKEKEKKAAQRPEPEKKKPVVKTAAVSTPTQAANTKSPCKTSIQPEAYPSQRHVQALCQPTFGVFSNPVTVPVWWRQPSEPEVSAMGAAAAGAGAALSGLWMPAPAVAAVKSLVIPATISASKPHSPAVPVQPNFFTSPWNRFAGHSPIS